MMRSAAPTITVPGAQTIEVNQSTSIGSVRLAESGATTGETFTVTLKDSNGLLSATATETGDTVTGAGTDDLVIQGTLSQVNSDLGTLTDKDGTAGPDSITLNAIDSLGNSATQKAIAVTAENPNADDWTNASGGNWATASNWNNGVPTSATTAQLNSSGTYTVTSAASVTVNELDSISSVTLDITGGTFTVTDFAGQGSRFCPAAHWTSGAALRPWRR